MVGTATAISPHRPYKHATKMLIPYIL